MSRSDYALVENWDFRSIHTVDELHRHFFTRYAWNSETGDLKNDEWQRYADRDNHRVGEGRLDLVAHNRSGQGALDAVRRAFETDKRGERTGIEAGMIRSRRSFRYGVIEGRLRPPRGRGLWSAFWILPNDGSWPPEIDIVEVVDNGRYGTQESHHWVHGQHQGAAPASMTDAEHVFAPGYDYADAFHEFAVEWLPDQVTYYVDGQPISSIRFSWAPDGQSNGDRAPAAQVLLTLAVGGWGGYPLSLNFLPASLSCEWIRVWQSPDQLG